MGVTHVQVTHYTVMASTMTHIMTHVSIRSSDEHSHLKNGTGLTSHKLKYVMWWQREAVN